MIYSLNEIYEQFCEIWDLRDNRLSHMPFMSPWSFLIVILSYLLMIQYGKKWMEHRPPMQIDAIILKYNLTQMIICVMAVLLVLCYTFIVNPKFSIVCEPVDFSTDLMPLFEAYLTYGYFFLKLSHYFDTVFFILRKKWSQITFLHVYHHIAASIAGYVGVLYAPGGHSLLLGLINSLESGAMYTYYYLFISKPTLAQPMKKYIVRWQMVTFYMMAIHFGHVLVIPGHDCGYNKYVSAMGVAQSLMMIVLYTKNWSAFVRTKEQRKIE